jgi:hypothetical protein
MRGVDLNRGRGLQQFGEWRRGPVGWRIDRDRHFHIARQRGGNGAGEGGAIGGKSEARRKDFDYGFELAEILRQQRIGHRDWRIGNADMHGGKAKERMFDIVAGENGDRAFGA